jgi:hypothetical protein
MIDPQHVFTAAAKPALALPAQCCAVVCGAGTPLGEALLNQLLASPQYTRVFVATTAPLPATVAHLQGFSMDAAGLLRLVADNAASRFDFIVVAQAHTDTVRLGHRAGGAGGAGLPPKASDLRQSDLRQSVYAPLPTDAVPVLLRSIDSACAATPVQTWPAPPAARWLLASSAHSAALVGSWAAAYSVHTPCMVFGLQAGRGAAASQQPYQFQPQGSSLLDRAGVWVLNVLSSTAHGMLNPQKTAPLTTVKTAQRLVQRFHRFHRFTQAHAAAAGVTVLTPADLV